MKRLRKTDPVAADEAEVAEVLEAVAETTVETRRTVQERREAVAQELPRQQLMRTVLVQSLRKKTKSSTRLRPVLNSKRSKNRSRLILS